MHGTHGYIENIFTASVKSHGEVGPMASSGIASLGVASTILASRKRAVVSVTILVHSEGVCVLMIPLIMVL